MADGFEDVGCRGEVFGFHGRLADYTFSQGLNVVGAVASVQSFLYRKNLICCSQVEVSGASQNMAVENSGNGSTALGLAFFLTVLILFVLVLAAGLYVRTGGF